MGAKMKNKSFTIIEILIAVLVISVLSGIGIVTWDIMVDKTETAVCEQNQMIVMKCIEFYIKDNEAVPASLSMIPQKYTDMAFASLKKERPISYGMRRICLAMIDFGKPKDAWALPSFSKYVGMNKGVLICPAKPDKSGISYAFNDALLPANHPGKTTLKAYKDLVTAGYPITCDSNNSTFSAPGGVIDDAALRHGRKLFASEEDQQAVVMLGNGIGVIISKDRRNALDAPAIKRAGSGRHIRKTNLSTVGEDGNLQGTTDEDDTTESLNSTGVSDPGY
jgi:type II secretory pathway pseudopilin PulG